MPQYQGIWSLQQQAQAQTNQQWVEDPYFKNTVLLLQADNVANGSNNNLFIDSSSNAFEITRNGNTTQGSYSPYGPSWSAFFGGSGNYLSPAAGNQFYAPGNTGAWTFETWIYLTATTSGSFYGVGDGSSFGNSMACGYTGTTFSFVQGNGSSNPVTITASRNYPINTWHHYAVSKDSSDVIRLFVNGEQVGTQTYSSSISSGNRPVINGVYDNNGLGNTGCACYLSNLRWVKGGALYTSNFTPPTLPLTAAVSSGTCFLLFAQSNFLVDNSQVNNTFVSAGSITVQAYSPFTNSFAPIPTTYSTLFDGANAYANVSTTAANANLILSTSDFTIESWILPRALGSERAIISKWSNTTGGRSFVFELNSNNQPAFLYSTDGTGTVTLTGTTAVSGNTWTHVAISRSSNTANLYVNGILSGSNASFSPNIFAANVANVNIGRYMNAAANIAVWNGLISNARVVKGTAVYTSNFTPSQAPLTAIANTSLLACQSNTISDVGPSNFTIATQGNVRASSSVIPFAASYQDNPTYQTSTIGGSAFFDGNDYLTTTASASNYIGSGDFTVEAWVRVPNISGLKTLVTYGSSTTGMFRWFINNGTISVMSGGTEIISLTGTNVLTANQWYHIAVVRSGSGSNNIKVYVNGELKLQGTSTQNFNVGTTLTIGAESAGSYFSGYMADLRIVSGTALYTSNFAPPTAPLTSVTNTELLLNFTNASIYDATMKNIIETVGDVQISTLPYENGSGSIKFDGTGDYLTTGNTQIAAFFTGDFTVETWLYPTSLPGTAQTIFDSRATTTGAAIHFYITTSKTLAVAVGTTVVATTGTILELNKWSHVALVKNNGSWMIYINGKASVTSASLTNTTSLTQSNVILTIGASTNNRTTSTTDKFTGYMDDFRVTSGVARYTSNFIPPKQALPRQ